MPEQPGVLSFAATDAASRWDVPIATIGGLPIAVIDRTRSAELMIDVALARRNKAQAPLIFTSANGQVLSLCASEPGVRDLFLASDLIHADGMPMVFASRLFHRTPLPERVATTDFFHDAAKIGQQRGARMFFSAPPNRSSIRRFGTPGRSIRNSISSGIVVAFCAVKATKSA